MAFLKQDLLQRVRSKTVVVPEHPIVKGGSVPLNVRNAYLQGCVFATLMDDGKVSDAEKNKLLELAHSIGLGDEELADGIAAVSTCAESDRVALITEIVNQLKDLNYAIWFLIDFERMMAVGEKISEDGKELLAFIAKQLCGREDWRLAVWQVERSHCMLNDFNRYFWAAEDGDRFAQRIIGHCYLDGDVVGRDSRQGIKWLEHAAEQGYGAAQIDLARYYASNMEVRDNFNLSKGWYLRAVESGHPDAKKELNRLRADHKIALDKRESQRKKEEREKKEKREAQKARQLEQLQGTLETKEQEYHETAFGCAWAGCAIAAILIWCWLSWWQLILFGWIVLIIVCVAIHGIAQSISAWIFDAYRQRRISSIENS